MNDCARGTRGGDELGPAGRRGTYGSEILTLFAAADIELIPDNGEPHRMCAEQKPPVFDGMKTEIVGDVGGPTPVPAGAMPRFRSAGRRIGHLAC